MKRYVEYAHNYIKFIIYIKYEKLHYLYFYINPIHAISKDIEI